MTAPSQSAASGDFNEGRARQEAEQAARYRLIIEEGPTVGTYIYKTLDSTTGEVIRQFPREEVLKLSESGGYAAGALIDTSA
ncbi:flagellar protein FlaG [Brevundimonas bacteroides]|uniref:flagellar protein FlaG n=1 Tax=Brevundimonas bacteroides TaxID=74311 RepID=UPI000552E2E2|nr:flagellar protein FlaG [Brevundimonas bacteroides]